MIRKRTYRQTFSAIVLLMVMMLQMGVKSFHLHHFAESESITCNDCEHHRVHGGHLLSWDGDNCDCTLCQLLTTAFTACSASELMVPTPVYLNECFCTNYAIVDGCRGTHPLRGPPCFLL